MCKPGGEFIAIIERYKLIMAQSYSAFTRYARHTK